jgi:hypothetical protein
MASDKNFTSKPNRLNVSNQIQLLNPNDIRIKREASHQNDITVNNERTTLINGIFF